MRRHPPSLQADLIVFGAALLAPLLILAMIALSIAPSWPAMALGALGLAGALGIAAVTGHRIMREVAALRTYAGGLERSEGADGPAALGREGGEVALIVAQLEAATQRREAASQDGRERYEALAQSLPALVWLIGPDGRTVFQNRQASAYTGSELLATPEERDRSVHPDDRATVRRIREAVAREGREFQAELRLRRHDGIYHWHRLSIAPSSLRIGGVDETVWLATAFDIESLKQAESLQAHLNTMLEQRVTESTRQLREESAVRQKAEWQLRQSQKMEAISRLTGGIAHDLNNKLMVISANIDAVSKQLKDQPQLTRKLLSALVASDQASALMSKLLTFARQRELRAQYVDLADHLASVAELLERSLLSNSVQVRLSIPQDLWSVKVDPQQLETAIINLAVNARDAMAKGGLITIEAQNLRVPPGRLSDAALSGDFVQIVVHDTGSGIAPEHLEHVFEPFFTTKSAGERSGLGLSQVHGFIRQLGGTVEIDSTVGEGTSIALYLPRADLPARVGSRPALEDLTDGDPATGSSAEILIVDDEVEVAHAIQGMIKEMGYSTRVAIGASEALEALKARRPSLVLTDVTMPGSMDGVALGREIRRSFAGVPVVLITGNPMVVAEESEFPLLQKPITSRDLNAALQRHLADGDGEDNVVPLFSGAERR